MQSELLRVAVTLRCDAPPWHHAVVDAIRRVDGIALTAPADVVVDLAESATNVEPRFGIWRYRFGDGAVVAGGAAGTLVRLYRITADPGRAIVLHEGWYRARTPEAWGTKSVGDRVAPWAARLLRQIRSGDCRVVDGAPASTSGCRDALPPKPQSHGAGVVDTVRSWLIRERWSVGIVRVGLDEILQRGVLPEPTWLVHQPRDRFYADPFPVAVCGDRVRILVENYRYRSGRKRLTEIEIGRSAELLRERDDNGLPRRASYPFLLRRDGRLFCVPETHSAHRVSAFVFDDTAGRWTHHHDLLTGFAAVDSTLLEHEGRWWMFCTKQGDEDQTELHLFFAVDWLGPWRPHPLNPVKADTRSSRPAGACFTVNGRLYRPAQNCARRYGAGITINRIVELSTTAFREEPVLSLRPSESSLWPDGLHTINSLGQLTVVDGLRVKHVSDTCLTRV